MERDSFLYKARRKMQTCAFYVMPHALLSKVYFKLVLGKRLNLKQPRSFNEKLQWLKIYYFPRNPLAAKCTDKYQVREYIAAKGYGDRLTKLLGVWENANDIDFDSLPDQFVLKGTHGCAYNIVCADKKKLDVARTRKQLNAWLREDFATFNVELHYGNIKPRRIICEEYLGEALTDYKFFCFHGEPKFLYVSTDLIHDRQAQMGFFDIDGQKIPLVREDYRDIGNMEMTQSFQEMLEAARVLSQDFPFVRVDFFKVGDSFCFSELTFTPGAAMMPINPEKYDMLWGDMLDISELVGEYGKK